MFIRNVVPRLTEDDDVIAPLLRAALRLSLRLGPAQAGAGRGNKRRLCIDYSQTINIYTCVSTSSHWRNFKQFSHIVCFQLSAEELLTIK